MLNPPQTLTDLVAYLGQHPNVRCTPPDEPTHERTFAMLDPAGRLWWNRPGGRASFTPTRCPAGMTFTFRPDGFDAGVTPGRMIRFDYLPD